MPVDFRFDKSCDTVFPHPLHSRPDWEEIADTVNWLSSFEEWGRFCSAVEISSNELTDAMSCAGYRVPTKVGLAKYSWHDQFLADYRKCTTATMMQKYPMDVTNYIRRHNVPRKYPKRTSPEVSQGRSSITWENQVSSTSEETSIESKLDKVFDSLNAGSIDAREDYYIEVNRAVLARLRPVGSQMKTPIWLTVLLHDYSIYDIMAALMRAIKRHE